MTDLEEAEAALAELTAAIDHVLEIHSPIRVGINRMWVCRHDLRAHPCPTVHALDPGRGAPPELLGGAARTTSPLRRVEDAVVPGR